MATIDQVEEAVMEYARETSYFVTPSAVDDPLHPKPTTLSDEQFADFYFDLLEKLSKHGVKVRLPLEAVKQCRTWWNVCVLVNHSQV